VTRRIHEGSLEAGRRSSDAHVLSQYHPSRHSRRELTRRLVVQPALPDHLPGMNARHTPQMAAPARSDGPPIEPGPVREPHHSSLRHPPAPARPRLSAGRGGGRRLAHHGGARGEGLERNGGGECGYSDAENSHSKPPNSAAGPPLGGSLALRPCVAAGLPFRRASPPTSAGDALGLSLKSPDLDAGRHARVGRLGRLWVVASGYRGRRPWKPPSIVCQKETSGSPSRQQR
jgi:hypothetical protein